MSVIGTRGMMTVRHAPARPPFQNPFSDSQLQTIEEALLVAWSDVHATADEIEVNITARLVRRLDALMNDEAEPVPGFNADFYETLDRGNELEDYRGEELEKRPDITFRPTGRATNLPGKRHWGLFCECKRVGPKHTAATYCKKGLVRFIEGKYAWAVSIAMMVGYACDGYDLPDTIDTHFQRKNSPTYDRTTERLEPVGQSSQAWVSIHERRWTYTGADGGVPGPIAVRHVWLPVAG